MNRIVYIVVLVCLVFACAPSEEGPDQATVQADTPSNALGPENKPTLTSTPPDSVLVPHGRDEINSGAMQVETALPHSEQGLNLKDKWPSGVDMQAQVDSFLAAGFMKNTSPIGFGDLAYTDVVLDFSLNEQRRIEQLDGAISEINESLSFAIPVVRRSVDAISGSRQVNWEDVIVQRGANRWSIQPVSLRGAEPFEVDLENGIEFRYGSTIIRITKSDSVFIYEFSQVEVGGQETLRLSWTIGQYERGPVQELESVGIVQTEVPVVMVWEPDFITGYLVTLPDGEAEFVHRLRLVPTGDIETDRYNFLVLLTQHRGVYSRIPESIGSVDPVWLSLLMYDHVVLP